MLQVVVKYTQSIYGGGNNKPMLEQKSTTDVGEKRSLAEVLKSEIKRESAVVLQRNMYFKKENKNSLEQRGLLSSTGPNTSMAKYLVY
jgi:hypothetical protein